VGLGLQQSRARKSQISRERRLLKKLRTGRSSVEGLHGLEKHGVWGAQELRAVAVMWQVALPCTTPQQA
jgi:hypothetical protein